MLRNLNICKAYVLGRRFVWTTYCFHFQARHYEGRVWIAAKAAATPNNTTPVRITYKVATPRYEFSYFRCPTTIQSPTACSSIKASSSSSSDAVTHTGALAFRLRAAPFRFQFLPSSSMATTALRISSVVKSNWSLRAILLPFWLFKFPLCHWAVLVEQLVVKSRISWWMEHGRNRLHRNYTSFRLKSTFKV